MAGLVQDPNFWRRFSAAVHLDDAAKEQLKDRPNLQHSYVLPPSVFASTPHTQEPASSPMSQHHLLSSMDSSPLQSPAPAILAPSMDTEKDHPHQHQQSQQQAPPPKPKRQPSKLRKSPSTRSTAPLLPKKDPSSLPQKQKTIHITTSSTSLPPSSSSSHHNQHHSYRHSLRSPSSLSLSGRPRTHFKTWTTITAGPAAHDAKHRDMHTHSRKQMAMRDTKDGSRDETNALSRPSWLEAQRRKSRQRTWMCWAFWLGVLGIVGGVVVAVVVLRAHRVI